MAATGPGASFPLNTVGQIIRTDVVCYYSARTQVGMYSAWHRVSQVTGTGALLGDVATAMSGMFAALTKNAMSASAAFRGIQSRMVSPTPPSPPANEISAAGVGAVAGDPLPAQVSGLIGLYTRFAGRAFRGRRYIPFPSEADNDATTTPSAGYKTNLDSIAGNLKATTVVGVANAITLVPIIYHRATHTYTDVVDAVARLAWATQRRRGWYGRVNPIPI